MLTFCNSRVALFVFGSAITLALAGCSQSAGTNAFSAPTSPATVIASTAPGQISGTAHGGQQAIVGAAVTLWEAGTGSSYGTGATKVGTPTTTDSNGNFNLNVGATGTTPQCTTGQFNYITVVGGNPGAAGNNSYSALMTALPLPCSASTGSQYVVVNEATTVASVWALRQFMTIVPGATGSTPAWQIGAPATNVTGLKNAFAEVGQLVANATGTSAPSTVVNTVTYPGPTTTTYTTTVTPDSQRLDMVADILSACINTTDNVGNTGSVVCTNLAADVSTAQSGTAPAAPTDTIQIAYDIANAPGGIVIAAVNGATTGAALTNFGKSLTVPASPQSINWPYYMCTQYVYAQAPFPTTACSAGSASVAAYPSDFQLSVRWAAVDGNALTYGHDSGSDAIDANGNVWTLAGQTGNTSSSPVVEWDPTGRVVQAIAGSVTFPSSTLNVYETSTNTPSTTATSISTSATPVTLPAYIENATSVVPYTIAIDTNNNAWFTDVVGTGTIAAPAAVAVSGAFSEGLLVEVGPATIAVCSTSPCAAGTSTAGTVTGYVTGAEPEAIAIDGANNIWVSAFPTGNTNGYVMLQTAASNYTNIYEGQESSANPYHNIAIDGINHYAWAWQKTTTTGKPIFRNSLGTIVNNANATATLTSLNVTGTNYSGSGAGSVAPTYGAVDKLGNAWAAENTGNTGNLAYFNVAAGWTLAAPAIPAADITVTPSVITTTYVANNTAGGLDAPDAVGIDGANNAWVANGVTSTASGISLFSNSAGTNIALSPDFDVEGSYGFNGYTTDAPRAMAIGSSGSIFLGSGSNSYTVHTVGAAVPVVTPMSVNSGLGSTAAISAWSVTGGLSATFTTSTPPAVGAIVVLYGFPISTFFNGQVVTVASTVPGTSFTATVTDASAPNSSTENGSASFINPNNGTIGTRP